MPDFNKIGDKVKEAGGKMGSQLGGKVMEQMGMGNPADFGLTDLDAKAMETRLKSGDMTFDDFLLQVKVMQKASSMQAMLGKMGGGSFSKEQIDEGQRKMTRYGKYVEAMDAEERESPQLLIDETAVARKGGEAPRLERIASAAAATTEDVGRFVMEFNMMRGAAVKMANGESPEQIRESMAAEQAQGGGGAAGPMNRKQRRLAAKKGKKKKAKAGGFGR